MSASPANTRQRLKWFLGAVALTLGALVFWWQYAERTWLPRTHQTSLAIMRAVRDLETAQSSVGYLGTVLTFTNGGWLAVRYRDTHYNRVRSSAVAKSSDGRYLESHRHFCGTIQGLGRRAKEWQNSDAEYHEFWLSTWRDSGHSRNTNSVPTGLDLLPLLEASNLDAAIQALRALGFRDVPP